MIHSHDEVSSRRGLLSIPGSAFWQFRLLQCGIAALLIVMTAAGHVCGDEPEAEPASAQGQLEPGKVITRTYQFQAAAKEMQYALYLPKTYDGTKSFPLIVALHGLGSNPWQVINYPGLTARAEQHGYIVVAPMGYNERGWYGSRGTGGGRGDDPQNLGELSEQDVMNVLRIVREDLQIDGDRIFLYGHSMGGGGSLHLAMKYPEIWAGMTLIAPAIWTGQERLKNARQIPAFIVQGDKDRLVSVKMVRDWVRRMQELKMDVDYREIAGGGHLLVAWQEFDAIFEFYNKRKRDKPTVAPAAPPVADDKASP